MITIKKVNLLPLVVGISLIVLTINANALITSPFNAVFAQGGGEKQQEPNGTSFQMGNMTFSHGTASVNGIQLHYVIGGHGDPIVLLHGWPETWYEWHLVMPALAKNHTVIAPDLPGLGESSKPLTGYDGKTVAQDIHQLVTQLGFKTIFLVGHDIGTQIAYSYAAATSYGSKEVSSHGFHNSRFRTYRKNAIMVAHFPSNTRRTRSACTRKRDDVFIMVLS